MPEEYRPFFRHCLCAVHFNPFPSGSIQGADLARLLSRPGKRGPDQLGTCGSCPGTNNTAASPCTPVSATFRPSNAASGPYRFWRSDSRANPNTAAPVTQRDRTPCQRACPPPKKAAGMRLQPQAKGHSRSQHLVRQARLGTGHAPDRPRSGRHPGVYFSGSQQTNKTMFYAPDPKP